MDFRKVKRCYIQEVISRMSVFDLDQFIKMQEEVRSRHEDEVKVLNAELKVYLSVVERLFSTTGGRHDDFNRACMQISGDPETPPKVLRLIAEMEDSELQAQVASNPNTPAKVLDRLCENKGNALAPLRKIVAQNPSTPKQLLKALATDRVGYVRKAVAENPATPKTVLKKLKADRKPSVVAAARVALEKRKQP